MVSQSQVQVLESEGQEQLETGLMVWVNQPSYMVGDSLRGAVCVDRKCEPGQQLSLVFRGVDESISWHRCVKQDRRFLKREKSSNNFAMIKLPLVKFDQSNIPKTRCAFPFQINLPKDLAQSVVCNSAKVKALHGKIRYVLQAVLDQGQSKEVEPQITSEECEVQIFRPACAELFKRQVFQGEHQVGGYFGFKMQTIRTEFSIKTSVYSPGDSIEIKIQINNGESRHSVDSFRFKLCRRVTYTCVSSKEVQTFEYLSQEKLPGCKKYESVCKHYQLKIPLVEPDGQRKLVGSAKSHNLSVSYFLRCFTKVKSIFEVGQGQCVQFPLLIINTPSESTQLHPTLDASFKLQDTLSSYGGSNMNLSLGTEAVFDYSKVFWSKVKEPNYVLQWHAMQDKREHTDKHDDSGVKKDLSLGPITDPENIIPIGFESKNEVWPNYADCNNPDWVSKTVSQLDLTEWGKNLIMSSMSNGESSQIDVQVAGLQRPNPAIMPHGEEIEMQQV